MPYNTLEKLHAYRQTAKFKKANYAKVKAWRAKPENKPKRAAEAKRWRKLHLELREEIVQRHRTNNIDKIRERDRIAQAKSRKQDPEGQRRRVAAWRERKFAKQELLMGRPRPDCCELCNERPNGHHKIILYDHCHKTNAPRGWLCDRCNKTLGLVKDDPNLLRKMATYLET